MKLITALTLSLASYAEAGRQQRREKRIAEDVYNQGFTDDQAGRGRRLTRTKKGKSNKGGSGKIYVPASPPLPGVNNNSPMKPKVILAQDTNYPPYASIGDDLEVSGFGPDFARGLEEVCHIDVVLVETNWNNCWVGADLENGIKPKIGPGLLNGDYHGCTTYTHTKGVRNRFLEFSLPILDSNKAAGILTRLENGVPVVNGQSSLNGVKVGDVFGWAPTDDVLAISTNLCTGNVFSGFTIAGKKDESMNPNDAALAQLLDGTVDALWIYADQAANYLKKCDADDNQEWDCSMWSKFGTEFAYIQTGIYDYMAAGTTLAISKKGSGLAETLNPCIEAFVQTKSYTDICVKHNMADGCFANEFTEDTPDKVLEDYSKPTNELTTSCSDGYCPCP